MRRPAVTPVRTGGVRRDQPISDPFVDPPLVDPYVEQVDDECPTCGAYVLNHALHRDWHRTIRDEARRYKPPPTYR